MLQGLENGRTIYWLKSIRKIRRKKYLSTEIARNLHDQTLRSGLAISKGTIPDVPLRKIRELRGCLEEVPREFLGKKLRLQNI